MCYVWYLHDPFNSQLTFQDRFCHYPYLTEEDAEVQGVVVSCLRSHSSMWQSQDCGPSQLYWG